MFYIFLCCSVRVGFCTGHFVMVPLNMTYLHCLQKSLKIIFSIYILKNTIADSYSVIFSIRVCDGIYTLSFPVPYLVRKMVTPCMKLFTTFESCLIVPLFNVVCFYRLLTVKLPHWTVNAWTVYMQSMICLQMTKA